MRRGGAELSDIARRILIGAAIRVAIFNIAIFFVKPPVAAAGFVLFAEAVLWVVGIITRRRQTDPRSGLDDYGL